MIILGERHTFDAREMEALQKQFASIDTVNYRHNDPSKTITQINTLLKTQSKSTIVLNTAARIPDELLRYLTRLEQQGISYITIENFLEKYLFKCYIPEDQTSADFLATIRPYSKWSYFLKRLSDYLVSIPLGLISIPVVLISIYKIKHQSPGSILFRQTRIGQNGHPFTCYKFRSMHENSRHDPYTRENDDRIFPWGNFMRKTRIDELPQLINVIRGDMHLLGPRAEWNILVENYEKEIPFYHQRHIVKPGITGWAQVNYPYGANAEDARQKLMYDLYYIKNWSPLLELQTIWKTVMVVLGKKGL
jgi:lipopolysaccharide/colanic/teichoic acid biosynthesis glycosyltransferase